MLLEDRINEQQNNATHQQGNGNSQRTFEQFINLVAEEFAQHQCRDDCYNQFGVELPTLKVDKFFPV